MFSRISLTLLFFFVSSAAFAQEVKVNGRFGVDTLKIGEPVPFVLSARYPQNLTVIFPDSTFSFAPFEFQKKKFFTTKTTEGTSYDSVVYLLSTYEIDSIQQLKLPVFVVHQKDCTAIFSNPDEVVLKQLVQHIPDSVAAKDLPLKTNTNYLNVKWLFNYPLALIIGGFVFVLMVAGFLIFGKRVRKYFLVRKLNRNHQTFLSRFNEMVSEMKANFSTARAEGALVLWKYYMENLIDTPYSKLTSKEIMEREKNEELGRVLQTIDRTIYGGNSISEGSFENLRQYCEERYRLKLEEAKNG